MGRTSLLRGLPAGRGTGKGCRRLRGRRVDTAQSDGKEGTDGSPRNGRLFVRFILGTVDAYEGQCYNCKEICFAPSPGAMRASSCVGRPAHTAQGRGRFGVNE